MNQFKCILGFFLFLSSTLSFAIMSPAILKNDGKNWVLQNGPAGIVFSSITTNGNDLVAVGSKQGTSQAIFKSSDSGTTWTDVAPKLSAYTDKLNTIVINKNNWVAGGNGAVMLVSKDSGVTWTSAPLPSELTRTRPGGGRITALVSDGKNYLASGTYKIDVGVYVDASTILFSSDQGNTWSTIKSFFPGDISSADVRSIAWDGTQWVVAVSDYPLDGRYRSVIFTSPDAANWTLNKLPDSNYYRMTRLGISDKEWVMIKNNNVGMEVIRSTDKGKTWSAVSGNGITLPDNLSDIYKITYNGKIWTAIGSMRRDPWDNIMTYPVLLTTADLVNWTVENIPSLFSVYSSDSYLSPTLNDIFWDASGSSPIILGAYNKPLTACESFSADWSGNLNNSPSRVIHVNQLGISGIFPSEKLGEYTVNSGNIQYSAGPNSNIGYGLGGTCKEENGIATLYLSNNMSSASLTAQKKFEDDTIQIIQSSLDMGNSSYLNFTGTLGK